MKHFNPRQYVNPRLEVKDAGDQPDVLAAVQELTKALGEFRTKNDERLGALEGKELDPKLVERLDKLEAKINRPGGAKSDQEPSLERKAFAAFARGGKESLSTEELKTLRVGDDTAGGYLAPPEVSTEMIRLLTQFSPIRRAARVGQTGSSSVILGKRTGITNAQWEGEIDEADESEPAFGQIEIPVHGMRTYTSVSVNLLEDAVQNVEAELSQAFAEDFGRKEGIAFINGTGNKQPQGVMTHPEVAYSPNGHATNLQADGLIDLMHALPEFYRNTGAWLMNGTVLGAVRKLKNQAGDYLWREPLSEGNPSTLLGRPVIEAVDMPGIAGGAFPIIFGDFNQAYRIYDRVALSVLRDPYTMAKKSMVLFHARRRVGGAVVKAEAIRKLKMATS